MLFTKVIMIKMFFLNSFSTSLIIRDLQMKLTMRYDLAPVGMVIIKKKNKAKQKIPSVSEDVEKLEALFNVGGNVE